jgi:hypothetical protein
MPRKNTTNTEILDAIKKSTRLTLILSIILFCFATAIALLNLFLMTGIIDLLVIATRFLLAIFGIGITTLTIGIYGSTIGKKKKK